MKKLKRKWPQNNLRQLRRIANLTIEQLAERTDPPTSPAMIAKLETGERELRREWIARLAKALRRNEADILISDNGNIIQTPNVNSSSVRNAIRGQLDLAINLWLTGGDEASIHTLAAAAYKGIRPTEEDKNLSHHSPKGMILLAIMGLQSVGENLNFIEIGFLMWTCADEPKLFKDEFREFCAKFLLIEDAGRATKLSKEEFFKIIIERGGRKEV